MTLSKITGESTDVLVLGLLGSQYAHLRDACPLVYACSRLRAASRSQRLLRFMPCLELTSRDHSATSTFLHSKRLFQGPGLPPSNAVHPFPTPGDPPLPSHYHHARRGITTFLFQFPLPESSPSSIDFGSGLARLRYEVRASVGVFWKGEKKLVTDKRQVNVVERFDELNRVSPEGIVVGENGKIWMQGKVLGGFMVAGEPACIELQVKNHSTKKVRPVHLNCSDSLHRG